MTMELHFWGVTRPNDQNHSPVSGLMCLRCLIFLICLLIRANMADWMESFIVALTTALLTCLKVLLSVQLLLSLYGGVVHPAASIAV